jgi:hypothetical protein
MWMLFYVPCPTPDGQTAEQLYRKRVTSLTPEMRADAKAHGCSFHRVWFAKDGSAFYGLAEWASLEQEAAFYKRWNVKHDIGDTTILLDGDLGLVPLPEQREHGS